MGQLETLTALALGRGHYEEEVVWTSESESNGPQKYNSRGHPRNPETKKREREHIRAANEVMQVTGVVEDAATVRAKSSEDEADRQLESFIGFRLMEVGRACLYMGVWSAVGLRRRILLYRPYSTLQIRRILKSERNVHSIIHLLFSGLPTILIPHTLDYVILFFETILDHLYGSDENRETFIPLGTRALVRRTIQFQLFAILQQLNLTPESRFLHSLKSFIPFQETSLVRLKPKDTNSTWQLPLTWAGALIFSTAPLLAVWGYEKLKVTVSALIYRRIYMRLPRPAGSSIFSGIPVDLLRTERNSADQISSYVQDSGPNISWAVNSNHPEAQSPSMGQDASDDEDDEMNHAQLISFDVEPTESADANRGPWSAELRSSNDSKQSGVTRYRVTGLTLLPTILAAERWRDIIADILVMPIEALMVRFIGRAYRINNAFSVEDIFEPNLRITGFSNLMMAYTLQSAITGVIWGLITFSTNRYAIRRQKIHPKSHLLDRE
ncbi:Bgt-2369 [Blumeria graminis f. sp. tritici]|uniref:Bgt-2369 n=2 Tax=Blumeria graminis f. sp. tritici TaxID=62690 RepID=A0A061HLS2_BLUGR|nr:hypothetical protein BGT96224_2369 [Blumeria graminis f. sp. tritici 96224]VCU39575.1 Bgt-2369 [Blumeria graminis f. sp. tritici]